MARQTLAPVRMIASLSAALFMIAAGSCSSGSTTDTPAPLQQALERAVADNNGYGGGTFAVVAAPGERRFVGTAGALAVGGGAMTPATPFEIASVSKTFTATLILQLAEEGLLALDDPLSRRLPQTAVDLLHAVPGGGGKVTIRQLLRHTSGFPDYWTDPPYVEPEVNAFLQAFMADRERFWQPTEILAYAARLDPVGAPGERYHYSDTNYLLLALVAEEVTGRPLERLYRERFFEPLGMTASYLSYRETPPGDREESHRYEGSADLHGAPRQSADWGGGGLVSDVDDLARFAAALFVEGRLLNTASLAAMQEWVDTGQPNVAYGLGLFRAPLADGGELIGHDGHGAAFMYYHPQGGAILVGTLNQTDNDWWPLAEAYRAELGR